MITLSSGLQNSLVVLQHLRANCDIEEFDISVGTFTNCRECGLTFVLHNFTRKANQIFTFCIYEHRNSDKIIINGKEGQRTCNGDLPYQGESKDTFIAEFHYNEHFKCAKKLAELIEEFYEKEDTLPEQLFGKVDDTTPFVFTIRAGARNIVTYLKTRGIGAKIIKVTGQKAWQVELQADSEQYLTQEGEAILLDQYADKRIRQSLNKEGNDE